ncbi:hypothetical protein EVAR_83972_1 [Eumeta japonica]|uniref:Uncharacterized protein n=1 Tax=Eumeta variegata TaxID=151549 RepID=A0A4C1VPE7_EUMVA|nr:hypothetical protein EVAR_83972_1 [Eumeta japonica]
MNSNVMRVLGPDPPAKGQENLGPWANNDDTNRPAEFSELDGQGRGFWLAALTARIRARSAIDPANGGGWSEDDGGGRATPVIGEEHSPRPVVPVVAWWPAPGLSISRAGRVGARSAKGDSTNSAYLPAP